MIGKIERVSLREVWKHEATEFTPWLEENIDVLNEALDITLINVRKEQNAGDFSVDLVAEDDSGGIVVIENQLEKSDHDHLGKLLTYLAAMGANTAIWIVSEPRPEHTKAIGWLNESTSASFYLLKLEAIKIGDSPAAPLLTCIVGPSEEIKEAGAVKKEFAESESLRYRFWKHLLERASAKTSLHSGISPSRWGWISTGTGLGGLGLNYVIWEHDGRVELYIDCGKESGEENKRIFDQLHVSKTQIEKAFGESLVWERLDQKRASRISYEILGAGWRDPEEKWNETADRMIDAMVRLDAALKPHIKNLKI